LFGILSGAKAPLLRAVYGAAKAAPFQNSLWNNANLPRFLPPFGAAKTAPFQNSLRNNANVKDFFCLSAWLKPLLSKFP
jgi:hypothetical protein